MRVLGSLWLSLTLRRPDGTRRRWIRQWEFGGPRPGRGSCPRARRDGSAGLPVAVPLTLMMLAATANATDDARDSACRDRPAREPAPPVPVASGPRSAGRGGSRGLSNGSAPSRRAASWSPRLSRTVPLRGPDRDAGIPARESLPRERDGPGRRPWTPFAHGAHRGRSSPYGVDRFGAGATCVQPAGHREPLGFPQSYQSDCTGSRGCAET